MKKILLSAILAGSIIGLAGTVFLSVENKIIGAMLFTVGLFTICTMKLHLYTGKVCYMFQRDWRYSLELPVIWGGNLIGTALVAAIVHISRLEGLSARAMEICQIKLADNLLSIFLLAALCNVFIYISVDGFNHNPHEIGKYLSLFFGVMVFVICGFEHCVANMFYFFAAGAWSAKTALYLLIMTLGNAAGGVAFPLARDYIEK